MSTESDYVAIPTWGMEYFDVKARMFAAALAGERAAQEGREPSEQEKDTFLSTTAEMRDMGIDVGTWIAIMNAATISGYSGLDARINSWPQVRTGKDDEPNGLQNSDPDTAIVVDERPIDSSTE